MSPEFDARQSEVFDLGLIGREDGRSLPERGPAPERPSGERRRNLILGTGLGLVVFAALLFGSTVGSGRDSGRAAAPIKADPTFVASADPALRVQPESAETTRARLELAGKVGVALSMCNGMAKHFDETPAQVERAQRYADCLDGFELELRLPVSPLHHGYAISPDLEPAVVLHCGAALTGPDVSPAAMADFERCAEDAEVMFGLAVES